jgi:hypothetical protein
VWGNIGAVAQGMPGMPGGGVPPETSFVDVTSFTFTGEAVLEDFCLDVDAGYRCKVAQTSLFAWDVNYSLRLHRTDLLTLETSVPASNSGSFSVNPGTDDTWASSIDVSGDPLHNIYYANAMIFGKVNGAFAGFGARSGYLEW